MKKLTLIFVALTLAILAVAQTSTLIEYPYVVKHMSNKDQIFTGTPGKYFVGYSTISQGDSVLYYSTSGLPTGLGTYSSPLPIDSINTLQSNGKKVLARIKRGDTYGVITIADSNIVVCSYSTVNTTAKPTINYIDYFGKANVEVNNITQTYNGYRFVSNSGNDTYPGTKPDSAWATIAKVNASPFQAGDNILFKGGDVWREQLTARSGSAGLPIVYGAYGTGDNPVIEGADEMVLQGVPKNAVSLDKTFTTNTGTASWLAFRQIYTSTMLKAAFNKNGTKFRVKVDGYFDRITRIGGLSIGESNGTTDDFSAVPKRLTFSGIDSVVIPAGGEIYCDWVDFTIDTLKNYNVHIHINGANSAYKYVGDGAATLFRTTSSTNNTMTQIVTFEANSSSWAFIKNFEIANETVTNLWQKEAVTTQPWITWYNDTIAPLRTDTASLDVNGEWFWDSGTSTYYMYSSVNPNGITDVGQRGILIDASSRNYITLKDLTIQHSNNRNTVGWGSARGAIYMDAGSHLTVSGCSILDNAMHGIFALNSSYVTIDNSTLLRNGTMNWNGKNAVIVTLGTYEGSNYTFSNNISSYAGTDGVMMYPDQYAYKMKNISIHGNTFNNNAAAGAYTIKSDTIAIYNNTFDSNGDGTKTGEDYAIGIQSCSNTDIYNNTITNQVYNDAIQAWSSATQPSHNLRVFRNYLSGTVNGNLLELIPAGNLTMLNAKIFSNVFTGCNTIALYFDHVSGTGVADTVDIYNNTFYGNPQDIFAAGTVTGMPFTLRNNIFSDATGAQSVRAFTGSSITAHSNNLWYRASGNVLNNLGDTYTSATIATFEPTAQNTSPLFVNAGAGNFTLQAGSPAINAGVNVGLTTDILGNPIVGLPDIGANEYTPPVVP